MLDLDMQTIQEYIGTSRVGFWKLELENGVAVRMYADAAMQALMGVPPEITPEECCDFFTTHIHPDDIPLTAAYLEELLRGDAEIVYRYLHPLKGELRVRCGGRLLKIEGAVAVVAGYHREFSDVFHLEDRNLSEQWLVKRNRDLQQAQTSAAEYNRSITDHAACGIVYYTLPNRDALYMNAEALRVCGIASVEEVRQNPDALIAKVKYRSATDVRRLQRFHTTDGSLDYVCAITGENGVTSTVLAHTEVITTPQGERTVYTTFLDISENESLKSEKHILDTLCQDFQSFFYMDFEKETITMTKSNDETKAFLEEGQAVAGFDEYQKNVQLCFDYCVDKAVSPDFMDVLAPFNIKKRLIQQKKLTYRFCFEQVPGQRHYLEVFGAMTGESGTGAVVGYRLIDDLIAQEERKKAELREVNAKLEEQLHTIGGLSNAYFAVYWVDLRNNTCKALKNIPFFDQVVHGCMTTDDVTNAFIALCVRPEDQGKMRAFTDWRHMNELLGESNTIVKEFHGAIDPWEWCRASWIVAGRDANGMATSVLFSVEDITAIVAEKKQRQREHRLLDEQTRVISALSLEYATVWLIGRDGQFSVKYRDTGREDIAKESVLFAEQNHTYADSMRNYMLHFVCPEDQEKFACDTRYELVQAKIKQQPVYSVVYKRQYRGKQEYFQISFTAAGGEGSSDFIMGFKNINDLVLEEREQNEKLTAALAAADSANAAKTNFLSRMSHDIRTPLNGIIGLLEIDAAHPDDRALIDGNRKKMQIAADHLLSLINDVLQMSKLESGEITLAHEPMNLTQLATEVLTIVQQRAAESSVTIKHDHHSDVVGAPWVYGSPLHLRQIFLNIFTNCIKYNKIGGSVSVLFQQIEKSDRNVTYRWTIADTGIGMSDTFLRHIFDPFTQENTDARSVYQGTGLGMTIVKGLVEQMNGTIEVYSQEGVGSTFVLTIPFEIAAPAETEKKQQSGKKNADIRGFRLLLAEDNELNAEIARVLLEDAGAAVTTAGDGKQAVERFQESGSGTFDAILMDVMMPVMDGLTATKTIRSLDCPDAKTIPIIAMTANAFAEDAEKCLAAGMNAHLAKPLDISKVISTIAQSKENRA